MSVLDTYTSIHKGFKPSAPKANPSTYASLVTRNCPNCGQVMIKVSMSPFYHGRKEILYCPACRIVETK